MRSHLNCKFLIWQSNYTLKGVDLIIFYVIRCFDLILVTFFFITKLYTLDDTVVGVYILRNRKIVIVSRDVSF